MVDSTFNDAYNIMISIIFFNCNRACSVLYFCPLRIIVNKKVFRDPQAFKWRSL